MTTPLPAWDPVMLEVYLIDHEEREPDDDLMLVLRRSAMKTDLSPGNMARRHATSPGSRPPLV